MKISETDKDYSNQVLERFGKRHSSFVTQFTVLIIFAFSFIAFILAPIIALKLDSNRLSKELRAKESVVAGVQALIRDLQATQNELIRNQDLVNGELTSLTFVQEQNRIDAEELAAQIEEKRDRIATIEARNTKLGKSLTGLKNAADRMNDVLGSFDQRKRTNNLRGWFREMAGSGDHDPACAEDQEYGYLSCMVRRKLHRDWEADFARIDAEVISPLKPIEVEAAAAIETRVREARKTFETKLNENPNFWHTIDQKEQFMELLAQEFEVAFTDIGKVVQERQEQLGKAVGNLAEKIAENSAERERLQSALTEIEATQEQIAEDQKAAAANLAEFEAQQAKLTAISERLNAESLRMSERIKADRAALESSREKIEDEQAKIAARLTEFQSPFGKLPLGLNEATLAFPFVLAVGFLICALLLADLLRLRGEFHQLMLAHAGTHKEQDGFTHRVTLLAPLWLDPVRPSWISIAGAFLLLLPALAFIVTVWLSLSGVLQLTDAGSSERYLRLSTSDSM